MGEERTDRTERTDNDVLHAMYNQNSFVKVKQKLEIGKVLFSFVNNKKKNPDGSIECIDCYMDAIEFGAILMRDIATGRLTGALKESKLRAESMNAKYPEAVYTSPFGGCSLDADGKTTRDDSKKVRAVSRYFTIAPGAKAEVIITAYQYPANVTATGAYVKQENSKPEITVMVSTTYNDLRKLQYKWSWLEKDYMGRMFSMENMHNDYHQRNARYMQVPKEDAVIYNAEPTQAYIDNASQAAVQTRGQQAQATQPSAMPKQNAGAQIIDTDDAEFLKCKITGALEKHPNGFIAGHITDESDHSIGKLWFPDSRYDSTKTQGIFKIFAKRKDNDYLLVSYA